MYLAHGDISWGHRYELTEDENDAYAHILRWIGDELGKLSKVGHASREATEFRSALTEGNIPLAIQIWNAISDSRFSVVWLEAPSKPDLDATAGLLRHRLDKYLAECEKGSHEALVDSVFEELGKKT